jgi:hypothetical protein
MKKIRNRSASWLAKSARRGFRGYPIATVAFYGPTADLATKIAVAIIPDERNSPDQLERWFSEGIDVRRDPAVGEQVLAFLRQHQARSVVVTDSVIGCPHEEGIDYPKGHSCPHCPYWAGATASPMNASTSRAPGFSAAWLSRPLNYPTQSLAI